MPSSEIFASRYKIIRTLGRGGMGVVQLVEDTRQHGRHMALKTLQAVGDAEAIQAFRSEFRNLRGVVHPHIPEMFDFGTLTSAISGEAPTLYFTSEFVEGRPLDTLREQWTPDQLHELIVALSRALAFLHSRSLLHRDIKPENVLAKLGENGELALIKLVDFGLAAKMSAGIAHASGDANTVSGTLDYLAPELIQGQHATFATDLYAFGMLLYRLATGRMPFDGHDPIALTKLRSTNEAPPPLRFRADLPVGLSDVISSMVRLKSEDRPATARHVIAMLNEREGTDFPYESHETRSAYIRSAEAISNPEARAILAANRSKLETTTPKPIVITAPRGLGRTRLIRDFASELQLDGFTVRLVESDDDLDSSDPVRALLVPDEALVTREWLYRVLDIARNTGVWCIIGQPREDPRLKEFLGPHEQIELHPLTAEETASVLRATFPESRFPPEFAGELYDWTVGFPSALQRAFDAQLQNEMLRIGLNGWELLPGNREYRVHEFVAGYLKARLATLDAPSLRLLQALACSPGALSDDVLTVLCRLVPELHCDMGNIARSVRVLGFTVHVPSGVALSSRALAEILRADLTEEERRGWHLRLGQMWTHASLASHPLRGRALLHHDFLGRSWKTGPEEASEILGRLIDEGETTWVRRLLEAAIALNPPAALRSVFLDALSRISFIEGQLEESAAHLGELLSQGSVAVTTENLDQLARYAMLEERLGRTDQALGILDRCRNALPAGQSPWASLVLGTLAWITFKRGESEAASKLAEEGLVRVPSGCRDAGYALLLNTVATLAFYRGDVDAAGLAWQACLEVNEAIRDRKGIANMYNNLGVLAAQSGDRLRARTLWQKCAEIATEISDVHRLAGIYNNLGIDSLENGQLAEAEDFYLKSLGLFRRMKSPREQVATLSNLGELAYYRADYGRAQAYWQEAISLAQQVEDTESQIEPMIYLGKLLCHLDQLEKSAEILEKAQQVAAETGVKKGQGQALEGLATLVMRQGNADVAQNMLREANRLLSEDIDPLAQIHMYLTECALAADRNDPEAVRDALEKARKVSDTKWDPYTAARTLVYGLLFAKETHDSRELPRLLRQVSVYPDFLWKYHWAMGRQLAASGAAKKALDEFGRGVAVLKAITSRLSEDHRSHYLNSPPVIKFRHEALDIRKSLKESA